MIKCSNRQRRELKTALAWRMPPAQRQRIQMVLLRESGITQAAIAEAMGVSLSTVNRAHMAYDRGGIKALKPKPNGGRKRENMTVGVSSPVARHSRWQSPGPVGRGPMRDLYAKHKPFSRSDGVGPRRNRVPPAAGCAAAADNRRSFGSHECSISTDAAGRGSWRAA